MNNSKQKGGREKRASIRNERSSRRGEGRFKNPLAEGGGGGLRIPPPGVPSLQLAERTVSPAQTINCFLNIKSLKITVNHSKLR